MQAGKRQAVRDRQHRQTGAPIILDPVERQRPEVRWRPDENDQEEHQRLRTDVIGHRCPAEHRRHRAGRTADHDVLGRGRLEHDGVDQGIADKGRQREPHGERIDESQQQPGACATQQGGKGERPRDRDVAPRRRAGPRAGHAGIDAALDHAVEGKTRARQQRDAGDAEHQNPPGHKLIGGQHHADDRAKRGQHDDSRLGQLNVLTQRMGERWRRMFEQVHRGEDRAIRLWPVLTRPARLP